MAEFILLMHGDSDQDAGSENWQPYLDKLNSIGALRGGSAIGRGLCVRKQGIPGSLSSHVTGYVKIEARDLEHAKTLVLGNPVYESGGTVELRELPQTD